MSDASADDESFQYKRPTRHWRKGLVHEKVSQIPVQTPSVRREPEAVWCRECRKYRGLRHQTWDYERRKGYWWRLTVCDACGNVIGEDNLE
jgi:hypothetical protein